MAFGRVAAVLGGHYLVPICLKRGDHLVKARAVGPDPVAEHDARFGLHECLSPRIQVKAGCISRSCAISPLLSFPIAAEGREHKLEPTPPPWLQWKGLW